MMKIKILGKGVWGGAVASVIKKNNTTISFIDREEYSDDQEILIIAVPVQSIRSSLQYISLKSNTKIIINTSKGIERESHLLPYQIIKEVIKEHIEYYALLGPSFAQEVITEMPTVVNLGYNGNCSHLSEILNLFHTDFFIVRPAKGVEALELSGAFKNMYALICGLSEGLGYGVNTRVALIVMAMEEISELFKKLNIIVDPAATIGMTGDLILTCNSSESRNYTLGKYLAKFKVEESITRVGSTTEGYHSLASVEYFEQKAKMNLKVLRFIRSVIDKNDPSQVRGMFLEFVKKINQSI